MNDLFGHQPPTSAATKPAREKKPPKEAPVYRPLTALEVMVFPSSCLLRLRLSYPNHRRFGEWFEVDGAALIDTAEQLAIEHRQES